MSLSSKRRLWIGAMVLMACGMEVSMPVYAGQSLKDMSEVEKLERLNLIRMKQIPLLEEFVKKYPDSPRRPDTLYRLGEAYFETAKYYEVKGDRRGAEERQMKAIQTLEDLRKDHPGYAKLDQALFVLANSYLEKKMPTQAGSVLADLADRYPDSPVVQQASLLLGDHFFSEKQFARSESFYLKAAEDSKMKPYLHYKLAWVAINQNQPAKALKYFESVVAAKGGGTDYSKDAAREMIWPAIEVYGSQKVAAYLTKTLQDPALVEGALSALAQGLQQRGEFQAASVLFENLRSQFGQSPQSSEYLMSQVKAEEALGHTSKVQGLLTQIAQSAEASDPKALAMLMSSAKKFHAEGQKTKDVQLKNQQFDMAIIYYQAYLSKLPPSDPQYVPTQFYMGEVLYSREKYAEARAAYEASARTASSVQAQAAWNWFLTAEKLADGFKYKGSSFQAASANDENYIEAARFLQTVESVNLPQKRRASYQSARLLYQLNDYDRALPIFKYLAENMASTEEGRLSGQLVLDIYNLKKDYKQVAQYARSLSSNADSSVKSELSGIEQKAQIKSIQEEEAQAKAVQGEPRIAALEQVGRKYFEYAKAYPRAELVDAALWASFQNLTEVAAERKSNNISEMKESFKLLTSSYQSSKFSPKAVDLMGKFLSVRRFDDEELRDFRSHRDAWAQLMKEQPREERGPMAMLVYKLSGDDSRRAMETEFAKYPMSESNKEAIAYGRLAQIRKLHAKLEGIGLSSLKTLQKNTVTKINLLEQLQKDVTELANLKIGETTVAGLHVLADGYLHLSSAIRTAPIPSQLKGENLQRYQAAVNEKASDFEAKGQEARKLAQTTAEQLKLSGT